MQPKPTNWREHLTDAERATIEAGDRARVAARLANAARAGIVNRAVQRAKYAALTQARSKGTSDHTAGVVPHIPPTQAAPVASETGAAAK